MEVLAILLKQTIKTSKMKHFVQLLADKYKETKTAVLTALEKTFATIYENKCMTQTQFFEQLIQLLAFTEGLLQILLEFQFFVLTDLERPS